MVTEWGMSDVLGPVMYAENSNEVFLGGAVTQNKNMSEDTARLVDAEIKRLVTEAHAEATRILQEYDADLEKLAQALIEYETLTGDEIKDIIAGKPINRTEQTPVAPEKQTKVSVPEI